MTPSLIAACLWAVLAGITGLLPMRFQVVPGSVLLLSAPVILVWIGLQNGWIWTAVAVAAFLSMFRRPLVYLVQRAMGQTPERPDIAARRQ